MTQVCGVIGAIDPEGLGLTLGCAWESSTCRAGYSIFSITVYSKRLLASARIKGYEFRAIIPAFDCFEQRAEPILVDDDEAGSSGVSGV